MLQPKFVGPYAVVEVMPNHTYKLERSGQVSVQNEARLKSYWASPGAAGEAPPRCWSPGGRQQCVRGRRRGSEYEVVMSQIEDLVRQERPPPLMEVRPPPATRGLLPLPPSLPSPYTGSKVQNPSTGGAPSGDKENGSNRSGQEALPVETNNPSASTPPPPPLRIPTRVNEEGGKTANHEAKETPRVELNNSLVSTPPVSTAANSPPAGTPPSPQRGQRTRQPPAYLKDFVCDRLVNGGQESLTGDRTGKLTAKSGSYEHHVNIKFGEGGVGGKTTTPGVHSSTFTQQTRCPAFSYADAVKGRRISSTRIQAENVEYESKYQVPR